MTITRAATNNGLATVYLSCSHVLQFSSRPRLGDYLYCVRCESGRQVVRHGRRDGKRGVPLSCQHVTPPEGQEMPLDFSTLDTTTDDLPKTTRGRAAAPIAPEVLKAVKDSYAFPAGKGVTVKLRNSGKLDDKTGLYPDVAELISAVRRAANSLGYGVTIRRTALNKSQTAVSFRAKDKGTRRTKVMQGYLRYEPTEDNKRGAFYTFEDMVADGFEWDENEDVWIAPEGPDDDDE